MSAKPMTKSTAKLTNWNAIVERDRRAREIAERDGIALIEAYGKAFEEEGKGE